MREVYLYFSGRDVVFHDIYLIVKIKDKEVSRLHDSNLFLKPKLKQNLLCGQFSTFEVSMSYYLLADFSL